METRKQLFTNANPILRVRDVDASIEYYTQKLGFQLDWRHSLYFASVSRGRCGLFLTVDNQSQPRMWVWTGTEDAEKLHAEYVTAGAHIRHAPRNFPWAYEFQVEDLDGNVLRIGSDPFKDRPWDHFLNAEGESPEPVSE